MIALTHKRATVNGVTLHYVTVGKGPVVLCMHGWPQNHREFLPVIEAPTSAGGVPRIVVELRKLGSHVAKSTVEKYRVKHPKLPSPRDGARATREDDPSQ
jgi:pimeloyl-ACP methyl ester carboxylesterase